MSIKSNLYAEKIFAEHPTALWSLDESLDYVSLIQESQRDIQSQWSYADATVTEIIGGLSSPVEPFENSIVNLIEFDNFLESSKEIKFTGPNIVNLNSLDETIATICNGIYFYTESAYLQSISIGFEYIDVSSGDLYELSRTYDTSITNNWVFTSETFTYPVQSTDLRPIIKVKFLGGASDTSSYRIYLNGISIGQGSENFATSSLGSTLINFPSSINLNNTNKCFIANAYGLGVSNGYYLANNNTLFAQNDNVPMVFGGANTTKLMPNDGGSLPSLIVPGLGFLNESGRYLEYTVEMWMRINSKTKDPLKIFGPINSNNGLYVEDGFLILVIEDKNGNHKFSSHFVGQWYRPMLVQIKLIKDLISLVVNGEEVIRMSIDTSSIDLMPEYTDNKSNDWLGFYSYDNVTPFEIDCVAIYPYSVPIQMAKRRWVYGQAVLSPENINSAYNGQTAYIDYPFAGYTSNYNYPSHGSWSQGIFDNLVANNLSLASPNYELPLLYLDDKTQNELYMDCKTLQGDSEVKYITFRPNSSWNNKNTYMEFSKFNILSQDISSMYLLFSTTSYTENQQILFEISSENNYLRIVTENEDIKYIFSYNGTIQEIHTLEGYSLNTKTLVGVHLNKLKDYFGQNILSFLGNKNLLKIYIAGNIYGDKSFTGNIYTFGLSTEYNTNKISNWFSDQGIADSSIGESVLSHTASYMLLPEIEFGIFYIDIGISGYWQDYIPLTYFASYVTNNNNEKVYDLDLLQYNIDYPSPTNLVVSEDTSAWTYEELDNRYDHPVQKAYAEIDNFLFSGWSNYDQLSGNSVITYDLDTSESSIKSYVSFQYIADGANKTSNLYNLKHTVGQDKILDLNNFSSWNNYLFEVVDNTLIYPPLNVDFKDLALVMHLEFNMRGIFSKPISIRSLQIASRALDENTFNPIGTRFGVNLYPYTENGIYYDYKLKNPISIYKDSTPYLYTTRNSGIEIRGTFSPMVNRGLSIPLNENAISNYRVNAIQSWIRYDFDKFPFVPLKLMEIQYKNDDIQIYTVANSEYGNRAKIFALSKNTGSLINGIAFYINGNLVKEPVINVKEWFVLGISFGQNLNLDNQPGFLNLNGPFIYNNITYYQSTTLQQIQSKAYRPWLKVKTDEINDIFWQYWLNNYLWDGVLVLSSSSLYGVNPADVYSSYIGTNKIVLDTDVIDLSIEQDSIRIFNDFRWQSITEIPV